MFDQSGYDIRCEWGGRGIDALAPSSHGIVIVDIMSFSTCVSVATARGAAIIPWPRRDGSAAARARELGAMLAGARSEGGYSLSPASLREIPRGTKLVLPSPNGATLSLGTGSVPTYAGCLRNASRVAEAVMAHGPRVSVIPAGERWKQDGSLRPCLEDLVGAGAVIAHLRGTRSPEAELALRAFLACAHDLDTLFAASASGRELAGMGFQSDLPWITAIDADDVAPRLMEGIYCDAGGPAT